MEDGWNKLNVNKPPHKSVIKQESKLKTPAVTNNQLKPSSDLEYLSKFKIISSLIKRKGEFENVRKNINFSRSEHSVEKSPLKTERLNKINLTPNANEVMFNFNFNPSSTKENIAISPIKRDVSPQIQNNSF